jgi:hypothetical protein
MFNLIYRDGAPENAGHYECVKTDGVTEYKLGQAVCLDDGVAKLCGGATNAEKVYGIVTEPAGKDDENVVVLKVEKDMIFKCPITGSAVASAHKGMKLAISAEDYGSVVSAASSLGDGYIGAVVAEVLDAAKAGDLIEVRFEN